MFSKLPLEVKSTVINLAVGAFGVVIFIVAIITFFRPKNLTYDQFGHLSDSKSRSISASTSALTKREISSDENTEEHEEGNGENIDNLGGD